MFAARREKIDWVHSEGVYEIVPVQECRDAGMKPLDLIWVDTDKSVDPTHKKIRSRLCAREYKTKKQGKIQRALPASQLFCATPPLEAVKVLVSNHDVGEFVEQRETIEVETLRHQPSTYPRNSPETHLLRARVEMRQYRRKSPATANPNRHMKCSLKHDPDFHVRAAQAQPSPETVKLF